MGGVHLDIRKVFVMFCTLPSNLGCPPVLFEKEARIEDMRKDMLRNNHHLLLIVIQPYSFPIVWSSQVEEELLEQEFLERCFQEMLEEEDQDWFIPARDLAPGVGQIQQQLNGLSVSNGNADELAVSPVRMFVRQNVSQSVYSLHEQHV